MQGYIQGRKGGTIRLLLAGSADELRNNYNNLNIQLKANFMLK
jgi:hypothetical protein